MNLNYLNHVGDTFRLDNQKVKISDNLDNSKSRFSNFPKFPVLLATGVFLFVQCSTHILEFETGVADLKCSEKQRFEKVQITRLCYKIRNTGCYMYLIW